MKKKRTPATEPVIPTELLVKARNSVHPDKVPVKPSNCVVCGGECAPTSAEQLCWVCRRLKISAWHESEQMPAQE
jgi:hypothetical protein